MQKIHLDMISGQLLLGGRAGHCIVYDLEDETSIRICHASTINITSVEKSIRFSSNSHILASKRFKY